ncbi:MAG: hypothetical protein R3F41_02170 [Gammaproteobacteria bacterium]|nr:hypothetical protein [Pseudomonadales bacterium]
MQQKTLKSFGKTTVWSPAPRSIVLSLALLFLPVLALAHPIEGVWVGTAMQTIGGDNEGTVQVTNPRILIYTKGFFSWTFENNDRVAVQGTATDRQIADALRGLNVAAGTYMIVGDQIKYIRHVTGNPNGQLPQNQPFFRTIRTLTATRLETSVTNDAGVTTILRYRRAE